VRFAPSPTGFVHIGSLRTALYNYLYARNQGGDFILRIEDTDRERFVEGAVENLISVLEWAGLRPDEGPRWGGACGPYFQSERTETYRHYAQELLKKGHAYYSFDTPADIEAMRARAKAAGNPYAKYNFANRMEMRNSLSLPPAEVEEAIADGTPYAIRLLVPEGASSRLRMRFAAMWFLTARRWMTRCCSSRMAIRPITWPMSWMIISWRSPMSSAARSG